MSRLAGALATLLLLAVAAPAVAAVAAVPAVAGSQARQSYDAELTGSRPGAPTGLRQTIRYANPDDPDGKPFAVEKIVVELPPGARVDTAVPQRCAASDAEFQLAGADACPPQTRVGTGALSIDFGMGAGPVPRVVENEGTFFSNGDELILFTESSNTPGPPIRNAARFEVGERSFTSGVPPLPGTPPPDAFAAIRDVSNHLEVVVRGSGPGREAYLTTPPTCPPDGEWTITATFTYRDGVEQTEQSATPCVARDRPAPDAPAPDRDPAPPPDPEDRPSVDRPSADRPEPRADPTDAVVTVEAGGRAELPFTGLNVGLLALLGMSLAGAGLAVRRSSR